MTKRWRLGVDLRCLPADGSAGAGIAHATRALVEHMERTSAEQGIEVCGLRAANGFSMRRLIHQKACHAVFVPSGAISPWMDGIVFPWVHDLDIFDHPGWFPQGRVQRFMTTRLFLWGLRRSRMVFCVSQYTKRAIMRIAGIPSDRILVTGEGVVPHTSNASTFSAYALLLGTIEPRKNIPFILALWPEVCRRLGRTVTLVVAGEDGWGHVRVDESLPWLKRLRNVSDEEASALMEEATCVLVPSFSEGFGRVALEGMAHGRPVLASDRGALPEVIDRAGALLDPLDAESWTQWIVRMFDDERARLQFSTRGKERAGRFQWNEVACLILEQMKASC